MSERFRTKKLGKEARTKTRRVEISGQLPTGSPAPDPEQLLAEFRAQIETAELTHDRLFGPGQKRRNPKHLRR